MCSHKLQKTTIDTLVYVGWQQDIVGKTLLWQGQAKDGF